MEHELEYGDPQHLLILECAIEEGDQLPDYVLNAPELPKPLEFYYNLFWGLYRYRRVQAPNDFVPWEVLDRYAAKHGITELQEFQEFEEVFRAMERVYLKFITPEEAEQPKAENNPNGGFLGTT